MTPQATPSRVILYLAFAATGVCMALPGSVLPALLARWSLADSQAGLLFFMAWSGSSLGAIFIRPPFSKFLALGNGLLATACFGMAYVANAFPRSSFGWMALFGFGLGLTMTSTSLLQSARNVERRGAELNRLNLVWAIGASLCPTLAGHSLRITDVHSIFAAVGIFFALSFVWVVAFERDPALVPGRPKPAPRRWTLALWPFTLVVLIFLPTGIEASMGGWIAAYVQRTEQTVTATVTAGTCFWIGLMVSRTLSSFLLTLRRPRTYSSPAVVLRGSLAIVVAGILLLILSKDTLGIVPGVFLIGFGLGPVYPLFLAIALRYSENSIIFFVAGLGSAILPWITGMASSAARSLHTALFVPLGAAILMLVLGFRLLSGSSASSQPDAAEYSN